MPSMSRLQKPVLVLNASYEPINICAARRALILVLKGVAAAEEVTAQFVHSSRRHVPLPSVIRLLEYPVPQEHSDARPLYLPVLPSHSALRRTDS